MLVLPTKGAGQWPTPPALLRCHHHLHLPVWLRGSLSAALGWKILEEQSSLPRFSGTMLGIKGTRWSGTRASQHTITPDPKVCQGSYFYLKNNDNITCQPSLYSSSTTRKMHRPVNNTDTQTKDGSTIRVPVASGVSTRFHLPTSLNNPKGTNLRSVFQSVALHTTRMWASWCTCGTTAPAMAKRHWHSGPVPHPITYRRPAEAVCTPGVRRWATGLSASPAAFCLPRLWFSLSATGSTAGELHCNHLLAFISKTEIFKAIINSS